MRAIDLFCGAGGLSHGLAAAGFEVAAAVDSWQLAVDTYTKNMGHVATCADIRSITGKQLSALADAPKGSIELLAGGPPCQGFSIQRIGPDDDDRNDLIFEFAGAIRSVRPRIFLMENVTGLLGKRGSSAFKRFGEMVATAGYQMRAQTINAADFGVPQRRKRVLITGWRSGDPEVPQFRPTTDQPASVWSAIGDLPPAAPPGSTSARDPLHIESRMSDLNRRRIALIPPGGGFEDLPVELRVKCHARGAASIGHRGVYGRLDPDQPAGTVTARFDSFTRGRFGHPYSDRNITLREGARLQTFPDDYLFLGNREEIAAQIGNAIPPLLAREVGLVLRAHLVGLIANPQSRRPQFE